LVANQIGPHLPIFTPYVEPAPHVEIHLAAARPLLKNAFATFVDLRTHPQGSIPGAIAFSATQTPKILEQLKKSPEVIGYGDDEQDQMALERAARLSQQGVPHVVFLVEGWRGWQTAGYPAAP
jgi:rhodanese-related sulfurtransferase